MSEQENVHPGMNLGYTDGAHEAEVTVFGFWVFLMSDLVTFGLVFAIFGTMAHSTAGGPGPEEVTNLGSVGALWDTPVINQPQVAILGPGSVVKRPVVIDDPELGETIAVRHMVYLALTYDHRLVDGADAGRFLSEVKQRLETGQFDV